jgi:mono/diheme cytochrome c family protein
VLTAALGVFAQQARTDEMAKTAPAGATQVASVDNATINQGVVASHLKKSGRRKFYLACSACHGRNGETRMPSGQSLKTSPIVRADQYKPLIQLLIKGRKSMPSFALYTDDEIAGLALYIRTSIAGKSIVDGIGISAIPDTVCAKRAQPDACKLSASYQSLIASAQKE